MDNENDNNFSLLQVVTDPRSEEEKARDYSHDELAGAVILDWKKKDKKDWKKHEKRNQSSSLSCVAQSCAKAFEIIDALVAGDNKVYSAHPIYRKRSNYPEGGMWLQNAFDICKNNGTTSEALDPSQMLGESFLNADITVPTPDKIFAYVFVDFRNIDKVAEAIETHGHCVLIFHCDRDEYLRNKPVYDPNGVIDIGHAICGVDYFIDEKGDKVILIEDSSGSSSTIDKSGRRLITADFLAKRFSGGGYLIMKTAPADEKPKWTFNKPLAYGMKVEQDVAALQNILKYEGFFPTTVVSSGNYLDITAKAILAWQRAHKVAPEAELTALKGRTVGPKTRAALNAIYNK